jgi:hypothetical protein
MPHLYVRKNHGKTTFSGPVVSNCMGCTGERLYGVLWLSPAWQRKEGKSEKGGLNAKGRASYNAANPGKPGLKAPQPEGGSRRDSFCARMSGMKKKLTSAKTANDPDSRINKSLRAWNCKDGGYVTAADGCATKGKTKGRMV